MTFTMTSVLHARVSTSRDDALNPVLIMCSPRALTQLKVLKSLRIVQESWTTASLVSLLTSVTLVTSLRDLQVVGRGEPMSIATLRAVGNLEHLRSLKFTMTSARGEKG